MSSLPASPSPSTVGRVRGAAGLRRRDKWAIRMGQLAGAVSRSLRAGGGQQIPGRVMLACSPELPARLAAGRVIVLVSATNGKSAMTTMLAASLRAGGHAVASNTSGANMMPGLVTALADAPDAQYAVLETDEAVLPRALAEMHPNVVVLGELSRDQLDRHHEVRRVAAKWRAAFSETETRFVAPVNDPNVVWALEHQQVEWVEFETATQLDSVACPRCAGVLHRPAGSVSWSCACGLVSPTPVVVQRGDELRLGDECLRSPAALPGEWQRANRALAVTAAARLDVPLAEAFDAASKVTTVGTRIDTIPLPSGRTARLVLVKNPASWAALIEHLSGSDATLVFVQNDRSADGRDPSWLWDVPYEHLVPRKVVASGTRALDVAVRLSAAGLDVVAVEPDADAAFAAAAASHEVVVAASYTAYHDIIRGEARR